MLSSRLSALRASLLQAWTVILTHREAHRAADLVIDHLLVSERRAPELRAAGLYDARRTLNDAITRALDGASAPLSTSQITHLRLLALTELAAPTVELALLWERARALPEGNGACHDVDDTIDLLRERVDLHERLARSGLSHSDHLPTVGVSRRDHEGSR